MSVKACKAVSDFTIVRTILYTSGMLKISGSSIPSTPSYQSLTSNSRVPFLPTPSYLEWMGKQWGSETVTEKVSLPNELSKTAATTCSPVTPTAPRVASNTNLASGGAPYGCQW